MMSLNTADSQDMFEKAVVQAHLRERQHFPPHHCIRVRHGCEPSDEKEKMIAQCLRRQDRRAGLQLLFSFFGV